MHQLNLFGDQTSFAPSHINYETELINPSLRSLLGARSLADEDQQGHLYPLPWVHLLCGLLKLIEALGLVWVDNHNTIKADCFN